MSSLSHNVKLYKSPHPIKVNFICRTIPAYVSQISS
jgi:hypothetical protein